LIVWWGSWCRSWCGSGRGRWGGNFLPKFANPFPDRAKDFGQPSNAKEHRYDDQDNNKLHGAWDKFHCAVLLLK